MPGWGNPISWNISQVLATNTWSHITITGATLWGGGVQWINGYDNGNFIGGETQTWENVPSNMAYPWYVNGHPQDTFERPPTNFGSIGTDYLRAGGGRNPMTSAEVRTKAVESEDTSGMLTQVLVPLVLYCHTPLVTSEV